MNEDQLEERESTSFIYQQQLSIASNELLMNENIARSIINPFINNPSSMNNLPMNNPSINEAKFCRYCKQADHNIQDCPKIEAKKLRDQPKQCFTCRRYFKNHQNLMIHRAKFHPSNNKINEFAFKCKICSKCFKTFSNFLTHKITFHPTRH